MSKTQFAKYNIGQVIRHRLYEMRGVIFDVDASPVSADVGPMSTSATPGLFYRLFADGDQLPYIACIAEHDLVPDLSGKPVVHPEIGMLFDVDEAGGYRRRRRSIN
jgi:heat shock protein HspQ